MGKPKAEDVVKEVGANLDSWYSKHGQRIRLMGEYALDCQACKTYDAQQAIEKMMKEVAKSLTVTLDSVNKQNKKTVEELEKPERKSIDKQIQEIVDKKMTIFNKYGTAVRVKPSFKDGIPWLTLEGEF